MTTQWKRSYRLIVGEPDPLGLSGNGFVIEDTLRIRFEVALDERPWPNSAEISIWNLNPDHRDFCSSSQGVACALEAGYADGRGVVFSGYLRGTDVAREGQDWVVTLSGGDGELNRKGQPIAGGSIKKHWPKGTPFSVVIKDFAKELDVDVGNATIVGAVASSRTGPALLRGLTVDGPVLDEWIYLMRTLGLTWSIQSGALQLRVPGVPAGVAPIVSPFFGMVDSVRRGVKQLKRQNPMTKRETIERIDTVEGRTLLLPGLSPGKQFVLQSEAATGAYLCAEAKHVGDTHGSEWYTEFLGYG